MPDLDPPNRPDELNKKTEPSLWDRFRRADREAQNTALRLTGCALVIFAVTVALMTNNVGWKLEWSYQALAVGIVCFIEVLWRGDLPLPPYPESVADASGPRPPRSEWEDKVARAKHRERKNFARALVEFTLLIVTAIVTVLLSHAL